MIPGELYICKETFTSHKLTNEPDCDRSKWGPTQTFKKSEVYILLFVKECAYNTKEVYFLTPEQVIRGVPKRLFDKYFIKHQKKREK